MQAVMIQGTSSDAGKTTIVTGLQRGDSMGREAKYGCNPGSCAWSETVRRVAAQEPLTGGHVRITRRERV